jgi:hypothetical protein
MLTLTMKMNGKVKLSERSPLAWYIALGYYVTDIRKFETAECSHLHGSKYFTEHSNPKFRPRRLHCHETSDTNHETTKLHNLHDWTPCIAATAQKLAQTVRCRDLLKGSCVLCVRDNTIFFSCCVLSAQRCAKFILSSC